MKFIIRLLLGAIALWIAGSITNSILADMPIKGLTDPASIVLAALILGGVNALIRPLVLMFTCLLQLLTLGLFTLVVNALMLLLTSWIAGALNLAFRVEGFLGALVCAVLISIVSMILTRLVR